MSGQKDPRKTGTKRPGDPELADHYSTEQSSSKRTKQNRNEDPPFAEVLFDIAINYSERKHKRKETLENLVKHIVALLNSYGGHIRIDESENEEKTIVQQRDQWIHALEQRLEDIMSRTEYKQCIHYHKTRASPYYYIFVKKCRFVCTQNSGLKIPYNCSVKDATYSDISNILNKRVSVAQPESISSLEMSEEDLGCDSGYTEDISLPNYAEEEYAKFFSNMIVPFGESNRVQFKLIKQEKETLNELLKGIDNHLKDYISAFANDSGGKVYFGIDDAGKVIGQFVQGEDQKIEVQAMVEKIMTRKDEHQNMIRIWGEPGIIPKYGEQWSVEFVEVINNPEGKGKEMYVVVVKIFPFEGGMFLTRPLSWKVDETSEKVVEMDFDEWRGRHTSYSENYQEMLNRFECLTLDGINKRVYQLKDMAKKFAKKVFPAERRLKIVPENFPERVKDDKEKMGLLIEKLQQSYSGDRGFVTMDRSWSGNIGFESAPIEIVCDMFVMSHNVPPRLITVAREHTKDVEQYNFSLAKKLKRALVNSGRSLECFGIHFQIILLKDINDEMMLTLPPAKYPIEYKMTERSFDKIRESLVIVLAEFESSSFNPAVGVKFLYVLTPEQYKLSIKDEPFVIVSAPPGTGKTVVAIQRMKRLRFRNVSKEKILYICENKSLAAYVGSEYKDICIAITRSYFLSVLKTFGYGEFNDVRHIVVDEAQNFRNEEGDDWLESLLKILKWETNSEQNHEYSSLYIFVDYLQKIRYEDCGLSLNDKKLPLYTICELNCVIRNSEKIYEKWERIALEQSNVNRELPEQARKKQPTIGHDYEGRDVNFLRLTSTDENGIFEEVKDLIDKVLAKSYRSSDVAVLFTNKEVSTRFQTYIGSYRLVTDAETFPRKGLVVDSFRRFCGLEAPVVIGVAPEPKLLYENPDQVKIMLYSRAMVELYIVR